MEVPLRECLATAMWKANQALGLRVDIVKMIQLVLNELFLKTDSVEQEESITVPTTTMALSNSLRASSFFAPRLADMSTPDDRILLANETAWENHQLAEARRARAFEIEHHKTKAELEAMTDEEYLHSRYYDANDKQGKHHLRNMIASGMQSAKCNSGNWFMDACNKEMLGAGVRLVMEIPVDKTGKILSHDLQRVKGAAHALDGYVSKTPRPDTVKECWVTSAKTTLKERWNQDVWMIPHCAKLVYLTRDVPDPTTVESIGRHGGVVVYPHAPVGVYTWSFAEVIRRMKEFQQ